MEKTSISLRKNKGRDHIMYFFHVSIRLLQTSMCKYSSLTKEFELNKNIQGRQGGFGGLDALSYPILSFSFFSFLERRQTNPVKPSLPSLTIQFHPKHNECWYLAYEIDRQHDAYHRFTTSALGRVGRVAFDPRRVWVS